MVGHHRGCLSGDICKPTSVSTMFTSTLDKGHPSRFQPCHNHFLIKDLPNSTHVPCPSIPPRVHHLSQNKGKPTGGNVSGGQILPTNNGIRGSKRRVKSLDCTSPFETPQMASANKEQVFQRFVSLRHNCLRKSEMRDHFFVFMGRMLENDNSELAPALKDNEEYWYLPIFGTYHPKKTGQIRVMFDSSRKVCVSPILA